MGMFDSIRIPVAFCPYCGHKFDNEYWQTKTGEYEKLSCAYHDTIEDFAKHVEYLGMKVEVHHICSNCGEYVSVDFPNEWEEAERQREEQVSAWENAWIEADTSAHPNHRVGSYRGHGDNLIIGWSIGHCNICKARGQDSEQDIPDMDPEYREATVNEWRQRSEEGYLKTQTMVTRMRHDLRELTMEELDQILWGFKPEHKRIIKERAEAIFAEDTDGES